MQVFQASWVAVIGRFYLMMGFIVVGVFTGQHWITLIAFPVFLSCLLGISFDKKVMDRQSSQVRELIREHSPGKAEDDDKDMTQAA